MMEPIKVRVCVGTNCCFAGGEVLIEQLENDADLANLVSPEAARCLGRLCEGGLKSPVVEIEGRLLVQATLEGIMEEIELAIRGRMVGNLDRAADPNDESRKPDESRRRSREAGHA